MRFRPGALPRARMVTPYENKVLFNGFKRVMDHEEHSGHPHQKEHDAPMQSQAGQHVENQGGLTHEIEKN